MIQTRNSLTTINSNARSMARTAFPAFAAPLAAKASSTKPIIRVPCACLGFVQLDSMHPRRFCPSSFYLPSQDWRAGSICIGMVFCVSSPSFHFSLVSSWQRVAGHSTLGMDVIVRKVSTCSGLKSPNWTKGLKIFPVHFHLLFWEPSVGGCMWMHASGCLLLERERSAQGAFASSFFVFFSQLNKRFLLSCLYLYKRSGRVWCWCGMRMPGRLGTAFDFV